MWRLQDQLSEQRRLLQEQLDAESDRLDRQLAYDRHLRDREEARKVLDEALRTMSQATLGVAQVLASAGVFVLVSHRLHEYLVAAGGDVDEKAALAATLGMGDENYRLQLRFGKTHPLCVQYSEVRDKALAIMSDAQLEGDKPMTSQERDRLRNLVDEMRDGANNFLILASEYLDTKFQA